MPITAPMDENRKEANKTYPQDWKNYNKSQCQEKLLFMDLLFDLCNQIPINGQRVRGRPHLDLGDMIFCVCLKIYNDISSRRNESDLQMAFDYGYIDRVPHFNSILNYLNKPELKDYLSSLINLSALPLKLFESGFSVDATGFSTSLHGSWVEVRSCKSGLDTVKVRQYMKCHIMSGNRTNIITHVEVTDAYTHDTMMFPNLVNTTGCLFDMKTVFADKGYSSRKNMTIVARNGAVPYIPFRRTCKGRSKGSPMWHQMFSLFQKHHDEFMGIYHQRSNVESVFSSIKRKFGDYLRTKNEIAMTNEILCKCLVHNICTLIQEMYNLGIEICFENNAEVIFCAKQHSAQK
jgi:transposase